MTTTTIAAIASSIAVFILFAGGFVYYRRIQNNKSNYVHPDIENDIVLRKKPMPSSTTILPDEEVKVETIVKVSDQVPIKGQLTIKVIKGVEIKYRSIFGQADPYVSLSIGDDIKKTSVCNSGGMNPQWNEDVVFNIRNEDSIDIEVLDKQITGDDRSMGKCSVSISDWILHGYSGELVLINSKGQQSTKGPSKDGVLIIDAVFKSAHVQRLRPISIKRKPSMKMPSKQKAQAIEPQLVITVIRGVAIRSGKSLFGAADPYCIFNIGDEDRKTNVCPGGGMNPEWNEDILFQNIGSESALNIYIYDKDTTGIDRYMGECKVDIADWISNEGYNGELQIINRRGKDEGILIVSAKYKVPTLLII